MANAIPAPSSVDELYWKLTVAGAVFMITMEVIYFGLAGVPSFFIPSKEAFGETAVGRDFLNIWMGGKTFFTGGPAVFFDFWNYNTYLQEYFGAPDLHHYIWSYPPHILLFIWPFGQLPYLAAFALWSALGLALFAYSASRGGIERKHLLFVLVAPAVTINLLIGQNGFFSAAILIFGLINLDRRPILSGVLFGILTIKPQLGLLLPVMLVITGRWRVIASAAVTTLALVGATCLIFGVEIWMEFFRKVVPMQRYLQEHGDKLLLLQIPSAFYAGRLVGLPIRVDWILQGIVSAAALAAVVWTFWRPRDPVLSTALLVTAAFLFSPYTLNYDMVVLAWVAGLLRQRPANTSRDHAMILAIWTLPATMMIVGLVRIPFGFLVLVAFAVWLIQQLAREGAASTASGQPPVPIGRSAPA